MVENTISISLLLLFHHIFISASRHHHHCHYNFAIINLYLYPSITILLVVLISLRCRLWVGETSLSVVPLTPDWPLTVRVRLTGVTCWLRKRRQEGKERSHKTSLSQFSMHLRLSFFLCLSLSVSLCLTLSAWWCRAGQVRVIQGCKPEEDWIYL